MFGQRDWNLSSTLVRIKMIKLTGGVLHWVGHLQIPPEGGGHGQGPLGDRAGESGD